MRLKYYLNKKARINKQNIAIIFLFLYKMPKGENAKKKSKKSVDREERNVI